MAVDKFAEVSDARIGIDVMANKLSPCRRHCRVELLRHALIGSNVPDPTADHRYSGARAVLANSAEGQVHVLAMAEPAAVRNHKTQHRGQIWRQVMRVCGRSAGHLYTSVSAPE